MRSGTYKPKKYVLFFLNSCDHVAMLGVAWLWRQKSLFYPLLGHCEVA